MRFQVSKSGVCDSKGLCGCPLSRSGEGGMATMARPTTDRGLCRVCESAMLTFG